MQNNNHSPQASYQARFESRSHFYTVRGLSYHVRSWGTPSDDPIVLLHGWMDVSASFQFFADAFLAANPHAYLLAPDWRGYGLTDTPQSDCYWFPDYLADLDSLLNQIAPNTALRLVAHSMGGNVAMLYAGVRPSRVRALVNLDGVGLAGSPPEAAPKKYAQWLDELRAAQPLSTYANIDAVAHRLRKNNPRLAADKALFLASHWAAPDAQGIWHIRGDAAHKLSNPVLYRPAEVVACWANISAAVLMIEPEGQPSRQFLKLPADYDDRLKPIKRLQCKLLPESGHMMQHDQPEMLAEWIQAFFAELA